MAISPTGDSRAVSGIEGLGFAVRNLFPTCNLSSGSAAQSHRLGRQLSQRCSLARQSLRRSNRATNVRWKTAQPSEQFARDSLLPAFLATLAAATQRRWFCGGDFVAVVLWRRPCGSVLTAAATWGRNAAEAHCHGSPPARLNLSGARRRRRPTSMRVPGEGTAPSRHIHPPRASR
jgi:hypothetical protein